MFINSILQFQKQNHNCFSDPNNPFISYVRMNYFKGFLF